MSKKHDLPAMPFYIGDWLKCPEVRALTLEARAVWFDMLCYMWESTERGYLTINNKPVPKENLAQMLGISVILLEQIIKQLENFAVFSLRADGAIYSRRMVKDEDIRVKRAISGQKGGICSSKIQANTQAKFKQNPENEIEIESINANNTVTVNNNSSGNNKGVIGGGKQKTGFTPPTINEVETYCLERKNSVDPQKWHSWYTANGWKVGKNPMKDWRAAVRTWERKETINIAGSNLTKAQRSNLEGLKKTMERISKNDERGIPEGLPDIGGGLPRLAIQ